MPPTILAGPSPIKEAASVSSVGKAARRAGNQKSGQVDLPEQFRDASHMSCGEGRGSVPEGTDGMRVCVEEAEVQNH